MTPEIATLPDAGRAPAALRPGARLAHYEILGLLGEGGMGEVHAAEDLTLHRKVAIKLLREGHGSAGAARRVEREARAMAKLSHANVIVVYEVGNVDGQLFIAMEYVEGRTLRQWLGQKPRTRREILDVFTHAGQGLAAAHRAGLVHRDFKPDNVLVGDDGRVRVTDFGLAGASSAEDSAPSARAAPGAHDLTESSGGTPAYMAPEQHGGGSVDARADQFAFCVALHEALHGERPFAGGNHAEILSNIKAGRLGAPSPNVPAWLRAVVQRGLSVDPAGRFPSMAALLAALARDPAALRRRALTWAGVALLAGAAGVAGFATLTRGGSGVCSGGEARLAGVWDASVKGSVERAFLGTGRPHAADTYQRVERRFDEYTAAWLADRRAACEATAVRHEQSEAVLDKRMECFDRALGQLGALAALFGQGADDKTLDRAADASRGLADLRECRQAALGDAVPLPADAAIRARIAEARGRLAQAGALNLGGKYPAALPLAQGVADEARALSYAPLEVESLILLATLKGVTHDDAGRTAAAKEAVQAAARARDPYSEALGYLLLMNARGRDAAGIAGSFAVRPAADSAVARAGDDPVLHARVLAAVGALYNQKEEFAAAQRELEQAVTALDAIPVSNERHLIGALNALGFALRHQDKNAEALAVHQRAVDLTERFLGKDHPYYGGALLNLSAVLIAQGKLAETRRALTEALRVLEAAVGPEAPDVGAVLTNFSQLEYQEKNFAEAARLGERALAIKEKQLGPDHPSLASSLNNLGVSLDAMGRHADAEKYLLRALALWEKTGPASDNTATVLVGLGAAAAAQTHHAAALGYYDRALVIAAGATASDARAGRAEVLLATGKLDEAIADARLAMLNPGSDESAASKLAILEACVSAHTAHGAAAGRN